MITVSHGKLLEWWLLLGILGTAYNLPTYLLVLLE